MQGDLFLGMKYSEAMRKLYGYVGEKEFPDVWNYWLDCIVISFLGIIY